MFLSPRGDVRRRPEGIAEALSRLTDAGLSEGQPKKMLGMR